MTKPIAPLIIIVAIVMSLVSIDTTAVMVALAKIQHSFAAHTGQLQWVISAYLLGMGSFVLVAGRLGDRYGYHRIMMIGIIVFLISSLGCAIATGMSGLICWRFVQGIGAVMMSTPAKNLIINSVEKAKQGRTLSLVGSVTLIMLVIGPVIGAVFIFTISWRAIFAINVLACFAVMLLFYRSLPHLQRAGKTLLQDTAPAIDYLGFFLLTLGSGALIVAVMNLHTAHWFYWNIGLTIIAMLAWVSCYVVEKDRDFPAFDFSLFADKRQIVAAIITALYQGVMLFTINLATFLQVIMHVNVWQAGVLFGALMGGFFISAAVAGKVYDRAGVKPCVLTGLMLLSLGAAISTWLLNGHNYLTLLPLALGAGLSGFFITNSLSVFMLQQAKQQDQGMVAGVFSWSRQIGGTLIFALLALVFNAASNYHWRELAQQLGIKLSPVKQIVLLANPTKAATEQLHDLAVIAYTAGVKTQLLAVTIISLCSLLLALILRWKIAVNP